MSVPPSPPPMQRQSGSGCLAALMILVGGALPLPGLCSLMFGSSDPPGLLLAVGACGVALIWAALKR